jgi:hypothetical protein
MIKSIQLGKVLRFAVFDLSVHVQSSHLSTTFSGNQIFSGIKAVRDFTNAWHHCAVDFSTLRISRISLLQDAAKYYNSPAQQYDGLYIHVTP